MPLQAGTTLGPYAVTAKIGEGGMGEVYRARDTKLDRDVALKVLPQAFTDDPDRLARFEREAKVLASLNHPNIGHIYGLEEAAGQQALVLELVEGPTLADRIKQGPIPIDEALPIAKQIAEALEAAHEKGVIHRDLKPANIKVRDDGTVKVLDFGLAKAMQPDASDPNMSQSPTISLTAAATQMGMVIGTAAYMAPEQASGKVVDKRADVWAFGVVLYEMLTGGRPFAGDDVSKTLAHVIAIDPDWSTLPEDLPPVLSRFLRGCLEKNPKQRVGDVRDVRLAMEGAFETAATPVESVLPPQLQVWQRPVAGVGIVVVAVLVTALAATIMMRPEPIPPPDLVQFAIVPDPPLLASPFWHDIAISPDGTQVVYRASSETGPQLYLRRLDQLDVAPLRGAERGASPFFSPDGEWVGFAEEGAGTIQKVSIFGGSPVPLTESPDPAIGASWGADDQIIFGTRGGGLFRVSGGGGESEPLTTVDADQGETSHRWPFIIPGREAVVFVISSGPLLSTGQLAVLDLDTGDVMRLGLAGVSPHYVSTGHLVYATEDGSVSAVQFDPTSLQVTGNPAPLVEGVAVKAGGAANFGISDNGRLVYALGSGGGGLLWSFVWVDRDGQEEPVAADPANYREFNLSPDGTQVAVRVGAGGDSALWIYDLIRGTSTRLTFESDSNPGLFPTLTPDGLRVAFGAPLAWKRADGTGDVETLSDDRLRFPQAFSPDGTTLVTRDPTAGGESTWGCSRWTGTAC